MPSPTQLSLKLLRDQGWMCEVTEHWNQFARVRKDLFGFIDVLCVRGNEVLGVQATSTPNMAARVAKIVALQSAKVWLDSPTRRIMVIGWAKRGPRGKRKVWTAQLKEVTMNDFVKEEA